MAFRIRICKNDTTTWLRETFQATPLRVPEAKVQPLIVVAQQDKNVQFRGELGFLLKNPDAFAVAFNTDAVANVALNRTKKVDIEVGVSILDGLLQGFNMSPAAVGLALKGVKEISFSFNHVQRRWLDLGKLGLQLRNNALDLAHPAVKIFTGDQPPTMLLVSDAIVSNSFGINLESGRDDAFEAGIPAIQQYVADAKLNVKVQSTLKKSITFEGENPLTFAFSCVRLEFDPATGDISLMEAVNPKNKGLDSNEELPTEPVLVALDEDKFEPGLLSWD